MPFPPVPTRYRRRRWMIVPLVGLVMLLGAVGMVRYAPIYLPPLTEEAAPLPEEDGPHHVFGYATLANPLVRLVVVGRPVPSAPARLEGWRREGRDMLPDADSMVDGRLFAVDRAGLYRLDRYEETGARYQRFRVVLEDGREAWVYRLLPLPPEMP